MEDGWPPQKAPIKIAAPEIKSRSRFPEIAAHIIAAHCALPRSHSTMSEDDVEPLLDTEAASQRLAEKGIKRTPKTLRKLRCTGGGPKFVRLNGKPYYTDPFLDEWIASRLSAPIGSTSEADAA